MNRIVHTTISALLMFAIVFLMQSCIGGCSPRMNKWPHQVFPIDESRTAYIYYSSETDYCWNSTLVLEEDGKRYKFDLSRLRLIGDLYDFHGDTIFMMLHTFHEPYSRDTNIVMNCGTLHGKRDYTLMQTIHYHLDGSGVHCPYAGVETKDYKYMVDRITLDKEGNKAVLWYKMNVIAAIDINKLYYNDREGSTVFNQCIIDTTPGYRSIYRDDFGVMSKWVTFQPTSDTVIEDYFSNLIKQ